MDWTRLKLTTADLLARTKSRGAQALLQLVEAQGRLVHAGFGVEEGALVHRLGVEHLPGLQQVGLALPLPR